MRFVDVAKDHQAQNKQYSEMGVARAPAASHDGGKNHQ